MLIQTTRVCNELTYAKDLVASLEHDPLVGEYVKQLKFYPMTTREPSEYMGRITTVMESGAFFERTGLPKINPTEDRVMICGSMAMLKDCARICETFGLVEGANNAPATYVVERAFVG
ncbi:ferredoxin--NADP+ reductase [Bartonella sp. A1379B]|nr:ferredoxin--NADP+ reductase [Bartonella sp. A1379B]